VSEHYFDPATGMTDDFIWQKEGVQVNTGVRMRFAAAHTTDGKISYYGFNPEQHDFAWACERLRETLTLMGLGTVPPRPPKPAPAKPKTLYELEQQLDKIVDVLKPHEEKNKEGQR